MKSFFPKALCTVCAAAGVFAPAAIFAQVDNLRITEVLPSANQVEITNIGGAFVAPADVYISNMPDTPVAITATTSLAAGARVTYTFSTSTLNGPQGDLWLYRNNADFSVPANLISGVKWGTASAIGRTSVAVSAGAWPSAAAHAPAATTGQSMAADNNAALPEDWYIDSTPSIGAADPAGTPSASNIFWPGGQDNFETPDLGEVITTFGYVLVGGTIDYTVRVVNDVQGDVTPRGASTKWLRINDDVNTGQQRAYSPTVTAGVAVTNYTWTYYVNLEDDPPATASPAPRITIQHDNGGLANAFGVEFANSGTPGTTNVNLVVISPVGAASNASASMGTIGSGINNEWVRVDFSADFTGNTVSAKLNGGAPVSLPISLTGNAGIFRICYRGEGTDNMNLMLVDDVSFFGNAAAAVSDWFIVQ